MLTLDLPPNPLSHLSIAERYLVYEKYDPSNEDCEFCKLCESGDIAKVDAFLSIESNKPLVHAAGNEPLTTAIEFGNVEMARVLLMHGADLEYALKEHEILVDAVENGHLNIVKFLVEECKVDLYEMTKPFESSSTSKFYAKAVWHRAIKFNYDDIVKYLADTTLPIGPSLQYAIQFNKMDMFKILVSKSKRKDGDHSDYYQQAFKLAFESNQPEFIEFMLDQGVIDTKKCYKMLKKSNQENLRNVLRHRAFDKEREGCCIA
jgi:ankyrin repeat protein